MKKDKKFKRFTHKNGVTKIHFKSKDGLEVAKMLLSLFVGLFVFGTIIGLMFLFKL